MLREKENGPVGDLSISKIWETVLVNFDPSLGKTTGYFLLFHFAIYRLNMAEYKIRTERFWSQAQLCETSSPG